MPIDAVSAVEVNPLLPLCNFRSKLGSKKPRTHAVMIWGIGSQAFFLVDAVLLPLAIVWGQPTTRTLIACSPPD